MTVTLDLPPEKEAELREAASADGLDLDALLREAVEARLRQLSLTRPLTEAGLLAEINKGFPEAFWEHYRTLLARRGDGSLTPEEQRELIAHSDQIEERDAERLTHLAELARRRGIPVPILMDRLGLHPVQVE